MPYRRRPLNAPVVSGLPLRLFAGFVEGAAAAPFRRKLLGDFAVPRLERIDEGMPVPPELPWPPQPDAPADPVEAAAALEDSRGQGFRFHSAADFTAAYADGSVSPVDVARQAIAAIEESQRGSRPMALFIATSRTDITAQAEASAERWAAGEALGPLDGVPVAVKDEVDMTPYPTTGGTRVYGREPAATDASTVARLRAQGAVLLGKANMHELGIGVTGINAHHGPARNPYDPLRVTGGSSSGSAGCVGAGLGPIALGADGGGSIRIPAALCGAFGLKPTWGRVSEHGAVPLCWNVAHIGPIAATAADLALGYAVMAGPDPADSLSQRQPPVHLERVADGDLDGLRIGVHRPWFQDASDEVVARCQAGIEALVEAGAEVVDFEPPDIELIRAAHLVVIASEMSGATERLLRLHRTELGLDVRVNFGLAKAMTAQHYVNALRVRHATTAEWLRIYARVDLVATPTTACTAPPIPEHALPEGESNLGVLEQIMRFAAVANLNGFPTLSAPVGVDGSGLPVGLQLMARPWEEALLLRVARVLEAATERTKPRAWWDLLPPA